MVAAVALTSATYAWFANNNKVAASDLLPTHPSATEKGATAVGSTISVWNHRFSDSFNKC